MKQVCLIVKLVVTNVLNAVLLPQIVVGVEEIELTLLLVNVLPENMKIILVKIVLTVYINAVYVQVEIFQIVLPVEVIIEKVLYIIVSVYLDIGMLVLMKTVLSVIINVNLVI